MRALLVAATRSDLRAHSRVVGNHCDALSDAMLMVFYVIVGLSSKLSDVLAVGAPALVLVGVALSTHLAVICLASLAWNRLVGLLPRRKGERSVLIDVDTVVIARQVRSAAPCCICLIALCF